MGFLLGLERANLAMMSSNISKNGSQASSRKSSLVAGDIPNETVLGEVKSHRPSHKEEQKYHLEVAHNSSDLWMKEKEVTDIHCRLQPQFCDDCHDCTKSYNSDIRQRLTRTFSKLNAKWHSSEKISLVKVNNTTSEVVTGLRYSVDLNAEDEISGRSYSSTAINSLGLGSPQDSSVVNLKPLQRASI